MGTNRKEINRNMLKGAKDGFRSNGTFRLWAARLKKGHSFFSIENVRLTGRLFVSRVDMLRRVVGLESSTFFFATLSSRLLGGT